MTIGELIEILKLVFQTIMALFSPSDDESGESGKK